MRLIRQHGEQAALKLRDAVKLLVEADEVMKVAEEAFVRLEREREEESK